MVYVVVVCPYVRPSHAGIVPKLLDIGSCKQHLNDIPWSVVYWCQTSQQNSNGVRNGAR